MPQCSSLMSPGGVGLGVIRALSYLDWALRISTAGLKLLGQCKCQRSKENMFNIS